MTISVSEADDYLKLLLAEEADSVDEAAFPQSVRYRALEEAVIAIVRLRPDLISDRVELSYSADTDSFKLPDSYEYLLEIIGIKNDNVDNGRIRSLRASTERTRVSESADACWRSDQTDEEVPTHFVWSPALPKHVYIDGYQPTSKLVVIASSLGSINVDGDVTALYVPYLYFPALIDYALSRLYSREDTSAGDPSMFLARFRQMMDDHMGTDNVRNPLQMAKLDV